MRLALVVGSLTLSACTVGEQILDVPTDDDGPKSVNSLAAVSDPSLPGSLTCVGTIWNEEATRPEVLRLFINNRDSGLDQGQVRIWFGRGPQFRSHNGTEEPETEGTIVNADVQVVNGVVRVHAPGVELTVAGEGTFRRAQSSACAATNECLPVLVDGLSCWDEASVWGSPYGEPLSESTLLAHFDWQTHRCVDVDGAPALNDLPIEFVRESGFGDCADLRGLALNGDDLGGPDLGLSLRGAQLDGATLFFAQLSGSFEGADLSDLDYGYASIRGSIDQHTQAPTRGNCVATVDPDDSNSKIECNH